MAEFRAFLRRHALLTGFVAVLVPLAVLLALQSYWLARLDRASELAHQAARRNYLEAVANEVERHYGTIADRALNLPAAAFTQQRLEKAAYLWRKKPVDGARSLYVVDYTRDPYGNFYVYDPDGVRLVPASTSDESAAVIAAATPWQVLSLRGVPLDSPSVSDDMRHPDHPILLNPITDDRSRVVGLVAMVLDERYFLQTLLPALVRKVGPAFLPDADRKDLSLCVLDARGRVVAGTDATDHEVTQRLPFVFSGWTLAMDAPGPHHVAWARAGFAANMSLSVALAAMLLGGIVLALRAANRAMLLSEMKSEFVSNISHELRTPLASIRVFAELLRSGRAPTAEKAREYGEYIESESRRLTSLIDNILDFARIESGRKVYRFVRGDVREVVRGSLEAFEVRLRHEGFRVELDAPPDPLPEVAMDAAAIGQALHNLLDNAAKYSGEARNITVRLAAQGDGIAVSVRDEGVGIPRSEHAKIFDRFHRVGTGLVHDVKGSGLGLSIVAHIVEAHRGRLTVDSEPGRGSTFTVWLPAGLPGSESSS